MSPSIARRPGRAVWGACGMEDRGDRANLCGARKWAAPIDCGGASETRSRIGIGGGAAGNEDGWLLDDFFNFSLDGFWRGLACWLRSFRERARVGVSQANAPVGSSNVKIRWERPVMRGSARDRRGSKTRATNGL